MSVLSFREQWTEGAVPPGHRDHISNIQTVRQSRVQADVGPHGHSTVSRSVIMIVCGVEDFELVYDLQLQRSPWRREATI